MLTGVVRPTGNAQALVVYDGATGTVSQVTDSHGGVWRLGSPVGSGSSQAYVAAALAGDPADYWRLAETGTTDAINRVNGNTATYSSVTLGAADGPFEDAKAASFDGTSSYLVLPSGDIPVGGPGSVSMWFKTTGSGVLYSLSDAPVPQVSVTGWNPALYVGTDGKLRGEFWHGATAPITTSQAVNNGAWHHVVLAASVNSQSMYLDGVKVGSLTGTINVSWATQLRVGAGQWNGWPGYSGNIGYFAGQIAELAYYRSQLSDAQVAAQYAARAQTTGAPVKKVTVTDPDNHTVTHAFDMADRKVGETDTLGNTTNYGYDTSGFLRTVTDPNGNVTTTEHDARGNTVSSQTCQDRSAQRCSTVYYTYYPDGPAKSFFDAADILLSPRDFDGDGKPDVIYRRNDNHRLYLMQGNGSGGWRTGVPVEIGQGWNVADQIFSSGDFDGDGKADVLCRQSDGRIWLYRGDGLGGFLGSAQMGPESFAAADRIFSPGDFDGDGKADVLYRNGTDTHLYLIKGNGAGGWLTGQSIQIGTYWSDVDKIFSPGDFDGDGKADVVYRRTSDKHLYLIKGNGTGGWLTGTSIDITTELPDPRNDQVLTARDGRSASATDNTYRTTYTYDAAGNRTKVTDPLGRDTVTAYTDGETVAAQDGGLAPAGLPMTLTTAEGAVQRVVYLRSGDLATVTDPAGKVTTFGYDGIGRVVSKTETTDSFPAGLTTTYGYDGQSRQVSQTDPPTTNRVTGAVHTAVTTTAYNVDGQVTSQTVTDSTGGDAPRTTSATYNTRGQQVTATDAGGKATTFEYDNYGRPVKETAADGGVTTTSYDAEGRILTSTVVGYTGDPNNPSPPTDLVVSSRAYDPAGRLASVTDAMGWVTSYTYTDNNLVARVTRRDPSTSDSFVMEDNTYDAAGSLTARVTNGGVTNVTYTLDAAGRVVSSTVDPGGLGRTTSYGYSRDDHVVTTTLSDSTAVLASTDTLYDPLGRVLATTRAATTALAPVGRWLLNETTGLTAADSAGNSPGTGTSGITWSSEHGGSAVFNSGSSISTSGPLLDTNRSYTVSAWVKLTDASWNKAAVSQDGGHIFGFTLGYTHLSGDRWKFTVNDPSRTTGGQWAEVRSTATPSTGTWAHLTGVYDQAAGEIRLYLNGTLQGTAAWSTAGLATATGPLRIGELKWNGSTGVDRWTGNIADVQVYQKALTDAEVTSVSNGSAPAAGAGVVRTSWTLDQSGLATSMTDPRGNRTDYSLDEAGRVAVTVGPAVLTEVGGGPRCCPDRCPTPATTPSARWSNPRIRTATSPPPPTTPTVGWRRPPCLPTPHPGRRRRSPRW